MKLASLGVRGRLTAWYTLALAVIIVLFSLGVFLFVKASLLRQLDKAVNDDFQEISRASIEDQGRLPDFETEGAAEYFQIVKEGELFYETPAYKKAGLPVFSAPTDDLVRSVRSPDRLRFRLRTGRIAPGLVLTIAEEEEPVRSVLRTLAAITLLTFPLSLALAALGGSFMARRLMTPVKTLTDRADTISADNLSARIPVGNAADEFGRLAAVINRMLSRLEQAFERLRRFTADASHQLRTPLTVIRSVGEVALQEDLDPAAYRDRIGSMLEEVDRLTRIIDHLLTLTRADEGSAALKMEAVDACGIVEHVVEDLRPLAEEKSQTLELVLDGPALIMADAATLRLAVANLLDNAVKYTPAGGRISVRLGPREDRAVIEVSDTGPGILAGHGDRIFDRFYRVDNDRGGSPAGAGLGLAIAKWAVEANGGRIEWESREGSGSTFRIVLPLFRVGTR